MHDNTILQTSAAARVLGVSAQCIRDLVQQGKLPATRTERGLLLLRFKDLERLRIERDAARDARG